jgi:hypothetical protein
MQQGQQPANYQQGQQPVNGYIALGQQYFDAGYAAGGQDVGQAAYNAGLVANQQQQVSV